MDIGGLFQLESHGPDTYVGTGPSYPWGGLYGGQIVAQALRAAAATVIDDLDVHSLRAYFIRRGDAAEPIRFEVDRIRNGRSFATRRVVARQAIGAILNLEASFQRPEPSADVQCVACPAGLPLPDELEESSWTDAFQRRWIPNERLPPSSRVSDDDLPTDSVREVYNGSGPDESESEADAERSADVYGASLDHSIWFHRPFRADEWHLHVVAAQGYVGGRGLAFGHVFRPDGVLAASVAQEALMRRRRHAPD